MKKIVFFNLNRINFKGGAEKYLIDLGNKFIKRNLEISYIGDCGFCQKIFVFVNFILSDISIKKLFDSYKSLSKGKTVSGIDFDVIKVKLWFLIPGSCSRKKIKKTIKSSEITFVKNEFPDLFFHRFLMSKSKKNYCIVFTSIFYPEAASLRSKIHNWVYASFFYKNLLDFYDGIIVSNKFDENILSGKMGISKKKIYYFPYGIDYDDFMQEKADCEIEGLDPSKKKILFVGRLEEQKGVKDLVEVIKISNRKPNDYQFIICGSGPLGDFLLNFSKKYENVIFLGFMPFSKLIDLYGKIDTVLILSKWETFCYVALEAQLLGKTVLSYDISGPNEIILDGISGKIIRNGIEEVVDNLNVCFNFDRKYFIEKFSLDSLADKYENLMAG